MNCVASLSLLILAFVAVGCGNSKPEPAQIPDQPTMMAPRDEKGRIQANQAQKYNAAP